MSQSALLTRIVIPPVAAFLLVSTYIVAEALGFSGLTRPEAQTIVEAAAMGNAARALQLIHEGQSINAPRRMRPEILELGGYDPTPLEAAVIGRHAELVRLLLREGASLSQSPNAACFARVRLPDVMSDLNGAAAPSLDSPADPAAAVGICTKDAAR